MDSSSHIDWRLFNMVDYRVRVTKIRICALINPTNESKSEKTLPTNRWIILLELAPFKWLKFDLQPGITGDDGRKLGVVTFNSDVVFLDLTTAEEIIHEITLETVDDTTVKLLLQDLSRAKLNRYKFTESEEGRRYWISRLVEEWEKGGRLKERNTELVVKRLSFYYRYPNGVEERAIAQGEFY